MSDHNPTVAVPCEIVDDEACGERDCPRCGPEIAADEADHDATVAAVAVLGVAKYLRDAPQIKHSTHCATIRFELCDCAIPDFLARDCIQAALAALVAENYAVVKVPEGVTVDMGRGWCLPSCTAFHRSTPSRPCHDP